MMNRVIDVSGRHIEPNRRATALFRECMRIAVDSTDLCEPGPPLGSDKLREALAVTLGFSPDLIVITAGVRATVPLLAPFIQNVAFETPSFEDLPSLAKLLGCNVERMSWPNLQLDDSKAIWMTHPARNPDGASLSAELVERLGQRQNIAVINEIYRWNSESPAITPEHNVIAVGSLSKIWGPAARVGWIRGNLVTQLTKASLRTSSPPQIIQHAWASFLSQGGLGHLVCNAKAANASRQRFCDLVDPAQLDPGGDGPSVIARLPRHLSADEALDRLGLLGVKATGGHYFGVKYESLRFTFTNVPISDAEFAAETYRSLFS